MKKNLFVCENCKKEQTCNKNEYPYDYDWVYIFNIEVKIERYLPRKFEDLHFCSGECAGEYLKKIFEKSKGSKNK